MNVETHLWIYWVAIATEGEKACREARARASDIPVGGQSVQLLDTELERGLVAMSAAAHAIDGFFGAVAPMIEVDDKTRVAWDANGVRRPMRILETFKRGFDIGPQAPRWAGELAWLYDRRDAAVHPRVVREATAPHPAGLSVATTNHLYGAPEAARSVNLAGDVLKTCLSRPRAANTNLVDWCDEQKRRALETALRRGERP